MKFYLLIFFIVFSQYNSLSIVEMISRKVIEYGKFIRDEALKPLQMKLRRRLFPSVYPYVDKSAKKVIKTDIIESVADLTVQHGKKMETHTVLTKDNYFVTLHRLVPANGVSDTANVVILHHGLLGSSADWILLGPEKSLPYVLLKSGYDVWMINARGNYYSRDHVAMENDENYWNFTWQEMGIYDLPAVIDYIMKITKQTHQLIYIGHSMGATVFVTMLSFFPEYNAKFQIAVFLAPLVFMSKTKGPLHTIKTASFHPSVDLLSITGIGEFIPVRKIPLWLAEKYCTGPIACCTNPLLFLTGSANNKGGWNETLLNSILYNVPAGGSTKTVMHYGQMIKTRKFHLFQSTEKEIPIDNVLVPIVLISSTDDILSNTHDVTKLYFKLKCPISHYILIDKNITHMDFVWSPNADFLIFDKILMYIREKRTCNPTVEQIKFNHNCNMIEF